MTFYRRRLPHLQRDFKPHFVTFCTFQRWELPVEARNIVLGSCMHDHGKRYDLRAAVVMPDHVHLIFVPLIDDQEKAVWSLPQILDAIKGASAHLINKHLHRRGSVWQQESFDRVLRSSENLREKIQYLLDNPVRQGLVTRSAEYPWIWCAPLANPFAPDSQ